MYQTYKNDAAFLFVYIREAHPTDEWQMDSNVKEDVLFAQPKSHDERQDVAKQCCERLKLTMPCVVDTIENEVDALYAAWPERMFVIEASGRIAYAGKPGPFGFKPAEVDEWLKQNSSSSTSSDVRRQHGPMYQRAPGRSRLPMETQNMKGPS